MRPRASRFNRAKAKGSLCTVKITLPRIFIHAAQSVLGVFFALVFVKHHQHALQHVRHWIIAKLLRDGDKINARLAKLLLIGKGLFQIAEETREAMDKNNIKRRRFFHRRRDHFLKLWPLVVCSGGSCLDILGNNGVAVALAPVTHLAQLVGNGQFILRLACR
ncbi:MAG: hypothetical protein PHD48_11755 [Alphaproteobacteria bacterium]|nr:hypothetical protein [Alphaproteobacteria bacterium]